MLIAYNNDTSVKLHDFLESCGDEMKQYCYDHQITGTPLTPPDLTEKNVMLLMEKHDVCFLAAHGDPDGVGNEKDDYVISTHTTNYNLEKKIVYCVSCYCALNLCPCLMQIGAHVFVGYNNTFEVTGDYSPFIISALSGLKLLLSGTNVKTARDQMNQSYDEQIDLMDQAGNVWEAMSLLHNKESLVFEGDDNFHL